MDIELKKYKANTDYKTPKNVLVVGVVHGDEPQGEYLINKYLKKEDRILNNNLLYIPRLNSNNKRKNKNNVDINRNFPTKNWELTDIKNDYFGGFHPNSEVETKLLVELIENNKFDAIITIHSPYKIVNYDGPAESLAYKISEFLNYPVEKDIGYPTSGSFGTYSGIERNIPTITIECDETVDVSELYPNFEKLFKYLEVEF